MSRSLLTLTAALLAAGAAVAAAPPIVRKPVAVTTGFATVTKPTGITAAAAAAKKKPLRTVKTVPHMHGIKVPGYTNVTSSGGFDRYLMAEPVLLKKNGLKVIDLPGGKKILFVVGSATVNAKGAAQTMDAEARAKDVALAALKSEAKGGARVYRGSTTIKGTTVVKAVPNQPNGQSGHAAAGMPEKNLEKLMAKEPVVATFTSNNGKVIHVVIGFVIDSHGNPTRLTN